MVNVTQFIINVHKMYWLSTVTIILTDHIELDLLTHNTVLWRSNREETRTPLIALDEVDILKIIEEQVWLLPFKICEEMLLSHVYTHIVKLCRALIETVKCEEALSQAYVYCEDLPTLSVQWTIIKTHASHCTVSVLSW